MESSTRCPGSGLRLVTRSYIVRTIEPKDRAEYESRIRHAEARSDADDVQSYREMFAEWEQEQGQTRERLVCPVCESSWLTPTASGTSRPHRRWDLDEPSWDKVHRVRKEMQVLQAELDRLLEALEP